MERKIEDIKSMVETYMELQRKVTIYSVTKNTYIRKVQKVMDELANDIRRMLSELNDEEQSTVRDECVVIVKQYTYEAGCYKILNRLLASH